MDTTSTTETIPSTGGGIAITITQHTFSPWEDNGNGLIYGQCSGDDDAAPFVADVCDNPCEYTEQEQANARLIVAAPDLLEACILLDWAYRDAEDSGSVSWEALNDAWAKARLAIAKAA